MKQADSKIRTAHGAHLSKRLLGTCRLLRCALRAARKECATCVLLALYLLVCLSACFGEEDEGIPTFRRVLLSPERLPEELKRVQDGVLVRLPVTEFDALVERATRAGKRKLPPQLLEARYHAALKDESLIGEGQWKLVHTGPGPGLLNLQPFNLALRQARFENGDARIAAFDGKNPALLVETSGERTVSLDWSARAEAGPEGLQFHLETPPCPVALLELDVPAGRGVTVLNDGALLSGPHEAEAADLRRWKIVCGGRQLADRQRIDIRIHPAERPSSGTDAPPIPFVHQKTTQKLHPNGLDAVFEVTLNGLSQSIRELICECDAELRLRDVVGPGIDGCSFQAGDAQKPSRLAIRLREPVRAGTWQILCFAPLSAGSDRRGGTGVSPAAWRSPGLRLLNSVPRGETLTLWIHPDLRIESWDSGSFRLSSSDLDRASGSQVLTLAGGGLGPPRRPAARLQAYSVDFSTQQLTWWRCDANGMALTVQIGWDVREGRLFQLPVLLPVGWSVEKVEMTPSSLLRDWHIRKAAGKETLFVNLAGSLGPRSSTEKDRTGESAPRSASAARARLPALTVHLRPGWSGPVTEKPIRFPDAVPQGARFREGALALDCDEQLFSLQVRTSSERTQPESEGPWGKRLPEYYYRYRGQSLSGEIWVRARPPRLRAKCDSDVFVAASEAVVETHLQLEAEAGSLTTVELALSAGDGGPWEWRNEASPRGEELAANRVLRVERVYSNETSYALHLVAGSHPLQAAVLQAVRPGGERWRLTLARPLRMHELLRLHARRLLQLRHNHWDVPLPVVLGAERMEGEVRLHSPDAGLLPVQSVGLRESASSGETGTVVGRAFRYGPGEVRLTLSAETRAPHRSFVSVIETARLTTSAGANGVLRHHFSFQVANWREQSLLLRLPPGSRPLAVQVDGRWLPRLIPHSLTEPGNEEEPIELALPVPSRAGVVAADSVHRFEILYTRKQPVGMLWQALDAPAPQLPVAPLAFRRIWHLPPKLRPLRQEHYQSGTDMADAVELTDLPHRAAELFRLPDSWPRFASVHPDGDSEWEPIAGLADERLIVVRCDGVTALGLALAVLFALSLWLLLRRSVRHRLILLLLALMLSGLGVLWLPAALRDLAWWPLLGSVAVALLGYLQVLFRKPARPQPSSRLPKKVASASAIAGIVVLTFFGWNGRAAAPAPVTVYLVPAPAEAPDKQTVLVPANLLDRLKKLDRPAPLASGGPRTVLLDASYEGRLVDGGKQAEFAAIFSAYSLSDEASTLSVPLSGVQLVGEILLDGARVAPLAAPQSGYFLSVQGRGRHKIELSFRVPVVGTVEDRNVRFTPPPLLRSRLSWRLPAGVIEPQVLVKNGAQWITRENGGERLEADLGAVPLPVHLHWYQPSRPTRVSYQAAYLWELGLERNRLITWLHFRVEQGAIKTLELDVPAELEVLSANAQRTVSVSRPAWRPRLQLHDWHVRRAGGKRALHLKFPYPISGDFQVTLELLPRAPLTSPSALPLPSLPGLRAGGPHYLAYRTQPGLKAQRDTSQNLTRIGNQEVAPDWPGGPRLEANFQGIAYRIPPDRPPQLILRLEQRPPEIEGDIDITVQAGMQRAEIQVVADVAAPNQDLAAVEWELPPHCAIASASGEDVRTWKQNGSRLLVWLNRTTAKTRIHLNGWLSLSLRDGHPHLEMSGPRLLHAGKQHTRLRLAASGDLVLSAMQARNLYPSSTNVKSDNAATDNGRGTADFETRDLSYHLDCQVQAAANATARVLTLAEVVDRELRFTTTVDYKVTHGELRYVRLRLRNWEEEKIDVQAEQVALVPEPRRSMGERSWLLPLQPGVRGHYQVTLRGSMSLDKAAVGVPLPEMRVQGVERAEYFLAVAGGELIGQAKGSLQLLASPWQTLQSVWPGAAQRLERSGGQAWRIGDSEWQMLLLPQTRALQSTPVRIYQLEQWAAVVDGRRWLHEARCWLRHGMHADFSLDFPAPARVLAATIDGVEVTPIPRATARVGLPLPGRPGVRCIRLRWLYDPPEPLDRPNLIPPHLPDAVQQAALWTIMVPPGWNASLEGASGWQGAIREAALALWRANGQLLLRQDLAKEQQDSVAATAQAAAGQRFALYCRQARNALDLGADDGSAVGPQGQSLTSWFEELQTKDRALNAENHPAANSASSPNLPSEPAAFTVEWPDVADSSGLPFSWQAVPDFQRPGADAAEPFTLQLTARASHRTRQTLLISVQWLGVLALVWLASALPFLSARLRLLWPEQIVLLGAFGWYLAGPSSLVLGLLFLAVLGRVFLLISGLRSLIHNRRAKSEPEA
jgi:hypothetical protein